MIPLVFWFVLGAVLGSFSLLIIERTPKMGLRKSLSGRSRCPNCQKTLKPADLIPMVSFILLWGRCRYCQKPIALRHILAEILFGLLGVGLALIFLAPVVILLNLAILSLLIIIAGVDFQTQEIVEVLVIIGAVLSIILGAYIHTPLRDQLLGVFFGAGLFGALVLVSRGKWMGVGDIEVGALLGLFLGYPNILAALFTAFITGSFYGVYLLQTKKAQMKSAIAFAPFLVLGGVATVFFGKYVVKWYLGGFL